VFSFFGLPIQTDVPFLGSTILSESSFFAMALVHLIGPIKNYFNVPAMVAFLLIFVRLYGSVTLACFGVRPGPALDRLNAFAVLGVGAALPAAALFELYYASWCPLNNYLSSQTKDICTRLYKFLVADTKTHPYKGDHEGPVMWADFGTLLAIMRGEHIMKWDPDSDWVSIRYFYLDSHVRLVCARECVCVLCECCGCVYVCTCACVSVCTCGHVYLCTCLCVCACVHVCMCARMCALCARASVCVCVCVCVCV
jgi:hypothetical protein